MNNIILWAGWYLLLLGLPVWLIGVLARDWAMKPASVRRQEPGR
ncbi:MAG: hypothetical protein AB7G48_01100 [Nitrospiraceae bacterium]